ncbi:MAG: FAD-dependent oxidoreductase [Acidobacteria bacterium]|nr:FAD-dependent oxidoreductase [Acidobacteriota bacterium]
MNRVTVVGGGVSGLVTSFYLAKLGLPVRLIEKDNRLGGLIGTLATPHGPVELAANSIRSSAKLETLCAELDLPLIGPKKESRARYIYRDGPRRWPLGPIESLGLAGKLTKNLLARRFPPRERETVHEWSGRVLGESATRYLVGAALQGIYAGDPRELSASLIFGKKEKTERGTKRELVAPPVGMSQLIDALEQKLLSLGVEIETGVESASIDREGPVVVATSASDAVPLLRQRSSESAAQLERIEMLPLVRVTAFYPASEHTIGGFGILFPREQGVRALGVLFNTNIFPGRGDGHGESWIYGGAIDRDVMALDDDALIDLVARDRRTVYGRAVEPTAVYLQRWPHALPHYDLRLERMLRKGIEMPPGTFLAGNYLRGIGLPALIERAWDVARRVKSEE